jgi:hypothetical protein
MLRDPAEMHAVRMTGKVKYEIPPAPPFGMTNQGLDSLRSLGATFSRSVSDQDLFAVQ